MSLSERLAAQLKPDAPPQCKIFRIYQMLPPDEVDALRAALLDPAYTTQGIADALLQEDVNISASSVRRHRKGQCRCGSI